MARIAIAAAVAGWAACEDLSFAKVHVVDHSAATGNWLFRSNLPVETDASGNRYFGACARAGVEWGGGGETLRGGVGDSRPRE
jgi:hypothetical protein